MYAAGPFPLHTLPVVLFIVVAVQPASIIPADAEWRLVDVNDRAKVSIDTETISRQGEWVRVWVMDDLLTAQAWGLRKYFFHPGKRRA